MALRILQFGIVFAIGFQQIGPTLCDVSPLSSIAHGVTEIPLSLHLDDPTDVTVARGASASLYCNVKSKTSQNSQPIIDWYFNDERLIRQNDDDTTNNTSNSTNSTKWLYQNGGNVLYLPKVTGGGRKNNGSMVGEYRCKATNEIGSIISNPAKVKIASLDRDFTIHPASQNVTEFQPVIFFCSIHSIPAPEIQWEYNKSQLPRDIRYVPLPTGALLITKTHSSDAGSYRCKATNSLLNKTRHSKIVQLSVVPIDNNNNKQTPPNFLPHFEPSNQSVTAKAGDTVHFYCAATGWPTPTVQWFSPTNQIIANTTHLALPELAPAAAGNYTCLLRSPLGTARQPVALRVLQPPTFTATPASILFASARFIRFACAAAGSPPPRIAWYKDGARLNLTARVRRIDAALHFSHTFTYDSGIYQCVATNAAGRAWAAAQLVLKAAATPSPPRAVRCRPYDAHRVCVTWERPPNVTAQAYTVNTIVSNGLETLGPEFVTVATYQLADNLNSSTNYTFYVRLFTSFASDQSNSVTCTTGIEGSRNLQIEGNCTEVRLNWEAVSTDRPCNGTKPVYNLSWRIKGKTGGSSKLGEQLSLTLNGLLPNIEYEFRIVSIYYQDDKAPWQTYKIPNYEFTDGKTNCFSNQNTTSDLNPPEQIKGDAISATSIKLSWLDGSGNQNVQYYTICSININLENVCKETKSFSTSLQIEGLQSNTVYHFKVKAHALGGSTSLYSEPFEFTTPIDVPPPVLDLKYEVISDSLACLYWRSPNHTNPIDKYQILYSSDQNCPIEEWKQQVVPVSLKSKFDCWMGDIHTFSTLLTNLETDKTYTVIVRAETKLESGKFTKPLILSTDVSKNYDFGNAVLPESQNNASYDQTYGIVLGVIIALFCIIICIGCIIFRKRCVKRRNIERTRTAPTPADFYPSTAAHYTNDGTNSVHVRFSHPCQAEIHEIEHLVAQDESNHIPTVLPTYLDTKGNEGYPNGHLNGSAKNHTNGDLRITENPHYDYVSTKSITKSTESLASQYEEDSNSNIKATKMQDLHQIYERSRYDTQSPPIPFVKRNCIRNSVPKSTNCEPTNSPQSIVHTTKGKDLKNCSLSSSSSLSSCDDCTLNSTQLTCLDSSFVSNNHRRTSPVVSPNG